MAVCCSLWQSAVVCGSEEDDRYEEDEEFIYILNIDLSYLVIQVEIVKSVMACNISPVAMFLLFQ